MNSTGSQLESRIFSFLDFLERQSFSHIRQEFRDYPPAVLAAALGRLVSNGTVWTCFGNGRSWYSTKPVEPRLNDAERVLEALRHLSPRTLADLEKCLPDMGTSRLLKAVTILYPQHIDKTDGGYICRAAAVS